MLHFLGSDRRLCDGLSRRDFLRVGGLTVGGLTLADLLRLRAQARSPRGAKAIIMVYLNGGPSHMDMYDLKPDAPVEYRGEFKPIKTNVPGMDICEHFPLQAKIADKFAIIRNMKFLQQGHTAPELYTGFLNSNRPSIGSVISKLRQDAGVVEAMPPFIALGDANHVGQPGFLGVPHQAFIPGAKTSATLSLTAGVTPDRLDDRKTLLHNFDTIRRDVDDGRGQLAGFDAFHVQALDMITSNKARDAFDLTREPDRIRQKYGKGTEYLLARRLVEAGVPVVTLTPQNHDTEKKCNGQWDHHDHIFSCLRTVLPQLDRSLYALFTDLDERGLADDVAVVVWGEMGRTPKVGTQQGTTGGRDHWPSSGFALLAGGGLKTGQVVGETDPLGQRPKGYPNTPQNVLATLYRHLGIDPSQTTIPDPTGRPIYLLDDTDPVKELV
ncbi:hypothetical protein AYO44_14300 [Planctomycetaceae bacterium SCGC AG-212-F19]|nr:hypothetical protein AYO44_14300 [Planctomycetaceae bacterium SCGC AG-212-F19]